MFPRQNPTALGNAPNNRRHCRIRDAGMPRYEVQHIAHTCFERVSDTLCGVGQSKQIIKSRI
jgi:hypothetical protein